MNSENKIVVTNGNGKVWLMTPEQIEAAYRYKERQYRISDAENQLELNADWIQDEYSYSPDEIIEFSEGLVERFQDNFDCNESEDDAWINLITEMFNSVDRKENNND